MSNRRLGTIAMICAPAVLVEGLIPGGADIPLVVGTASMVYMAGAFASLLGLWRAGTIGTNWWGRGVLGLQLLLVALAFGFGLFEATALVSEENPLFIVTDMAWPLARASSWVSFHLSQAVLHGLAAFYHGKPLRSMVPVTGACSFTFRTIAPFVEKSTFPCGCSTYIFP